MNPAKVNASKPDKLWMGPHESGCCERKQASQGLNGPYGPLQTLDLGNESVWGERKQAWQALNGPSGPIQYLLSGYESGRGEILKCLNTWTINSLNT